jgi:hypothetical protein
LNLALNLAGVRCNVTVPVAATRRQTGGRAKRCAEG